MPTTLATFDEPARWDLYGWYQFDIDAVRADVESALALRFESRVSGSRSYYASGHPGEERFTLNRNLVGTFMEPKFAQYSLLLYANTHRSEEVAERLRAIGAVQLRSEVLQG